MSGAQHKVVGTVLGMKLAYHSASIGRPDLVIPFALAVPFGAMLPDIDHPNSKLGRSYSNFEDMIVKTCLLSVIGYFVLSIITQFIKTGDIFGAVMSVVPTALPFVLCAGLAMNPALKSKFKFFRKHRGIMHTLIPVIGFIIGYKALTVELLANFSLALGVGYLCHIICDQETKMGNPLLFPFSTTNVPGLPIKSGSFGSWIVAALDCIAIVLLVF